MNGNKLKKVLAINDFSCYGKCSLTVSLPVMSYFGVESVPLPTSVLSSHTAVFDDYTILDMTGEMKRILSFWESHNLNFDAVATGYFSNSEQIDICNEYIHRHRNTLGFVLVDPVMADNGKLYSGFTADIPQKILTLCAVADIITPNLTEATLLTGTMYKQFYTDNELLEMLKKLLNIGCGAVVITGVRQADGVMSDVYFDGSEVVKFSHAFSNKRLHGSGDVFASVLCAKAAAGAELKKAVEAASEFTAECIRATLENSDSDPYGLDFERVISASHQNQISAEVDLK